MFPKVVKKFVQLKRSAMKCNNSQELNTAIERKTFSQISVCYRLWLQLSNSKRVTDIIYYISPVCQPINRVYERTSHIYLDQTHLPPQRQTGTGSPGVGWRPHTPPGCHCNKKQHVVQCRKQRLSEQCRTAVNCAIQFA